ncbi:hypothetical protein GY45DRAFT_1326859 [Cubamyces sp. BRFM 1775]|nr:hypothetical protein GY45DRAFT_1326859 [Cubamyces sp. BRFM 1775]
MNIYRQELPNLPNFASHPLSMDAADTTHPSALLHSLCFTLTETPPLCNGILKLSSGDLELNYGKESPRSVNVNPTATIVLMGLISLHIGSSASRTQRSIRMP